MNDSRIRAAAIASVALTIALTACSAGPSPTPSTSDTPAEETPAASASAPSSASPSPAASADAVPDISWERLELPELAENSAVVDVARGGPGFVALANDGLQGSVILTSEDGRAWTLVPQPEWQTMALVELVEFDGHLLAVGRDATDIENEVGVVWTSADGAAWTRAEGGPDLIGAQLIDVIATDDGLVAVGGYPGRDAGATFTSDDGEVWTLTTTPGVFERSFTWAVTAGGPGFVAVGWMRNDDPGVGFDPAFWTSTDGVAWTLAPTPDGAPGAQVRDVIAVDGRLLAVGDLLEAGQAFAWTSDDGVSWELGAERDSFTRALVADVQPFLDGALAVGGRDDDGAAWLSADGERWHVDEDPALADAYLVEALPVQDGVIVAGALQRRIEGTGSFETAPMIWYGVATDGRSGVREIARYLRRSEQAMPRADPNRQPAATDA